MASPPPNCRLKVIPEKPGYRTALEFSFEGKPANVMISDFGHTGDFNGRRLDRDDIVDLERSDL